MKKLKKFLTYEEQINLLKEKNLYINDEEEAINCLKRYSYYSLICGYKEIFKIEKNGNYRNDACFDNIELLYVFDSYMRNAFLKNLINFEKHIKSLYAYAFCELYGDSQSDYLNANNYNYNHKNQDAINEYLSIVNGILSHSDKYPNINYNIQTYGSVPYWILIQSLTFGNISKLYSVSNPKLQSKVAREFKDIYSNQLSDILNVLTKFRNVCAHGERFYNYKTQKSLPDLPFHSQIKGKYNIAKNDLFNVCICLKYVIPKNDFKIFIDNFYEASNIVFEGLGVYYTNRILESMGFPNDWNELLLK